MTQSPKEKALDLVARMNIEFQDPVDLTLIPDHEKSIECALIAVDEIIKERENQLLFFPKMSRNKIKYWQEVKQELEKM